MEVEPTHKRAVAFIDGQNLFHAVKMAFRYYYPNYDVNALARAVCKQKGIDVRIVELVSLGIDTAHTLREKKAKERSQRVLAIAFDSLRVMIR